MFESELPAGQHRSHDLYPVVPKITSLHHLTKLAPSSDRHCKTQPALLMFSRQKQPKKLRWAPGTVDNEMKSKAKPGIKTSPPARSSSNTSAKIGPSRHQNSDHNQRHRTSSSNPHRRRKISATRPSSTIPPWVPDAPRPKPPPAPRPTRLPTPDLPEIEGDFFFPAIEIKKKTVPNYSKMDAQCTLPSMTINWHTSLTKNSGSRKGLHEPGQEATLM